MDADAAADAADPVDDHAAVGLVQGQGRALELVQAVAAAGAIFRDAHDIGCLGFTGFSVQQARMFGDDHRHPARGAPAIGVGLLQQVHERGEVVGVGLFDEAGAAGPHQVRDEHRVARLPGGGETHLGGGLVAGHGRGGVVQDHQDETGLMKHRVDQGRDPGMEKGGVPDGGHDGGELPAPGGEGPVEPRGLADAGAHAVAGVHRPEVQAQGVAADVAGEDARREGRFDGVERGPVGAAGAEGGPVAAALRGRHAPGRQIQEGLQHRADDVRGQLAGPGDQPGGAALDPGVGQLQFDDRIGLFDDQDLFIPGVDRLDEVPIQRIRHGHLEKIDPAQETQFLQPVPGMGPGHPGGDDAGAGMGAVPGGEPGGKLRRGGDLFDLVVQQPVQFQDKHGGGAPAPGVFFEPGRAPEGAGAARRGRSAGRGRPGWWAAP